MKKKRTINVIAADLNATINVQKEGLTEKILMAITITTMIMTTKSPNQ
ncbi:hypothetical protein [Peribacillus acanthi]|nr:hypothetical protein [Peribacillus acanthi]